MPAVKGRRKQPPIPRKDKRFLNAWVTADVRDKAAQAADAAGVSMAVYLAGLVLRDEVDASGCPVWLPRSASDQEELPLKTA